MYENITKVTENFNSKYCIGVGGYGSVYKAVFPTSQVVVVKKLHPLLDGEKSNQKAFMSEIHTLTEIRHRNIVRLYEANKDGNFLTPPSRKGKKVASYPCDNSSGYLRKTYSYELEKSDCAALCNNLVRDYVYWGGVLFLRFLLSLVDESEKIRQLAEYLYGNILKGCFPNSCMQRVRIPSNRGTSTATANIDEEGRDSGGASTTATRGRAITLAVRKGLI
ncbi:mdis1-interacting receptor like kinase 2 [Quercus suber]|uniref:non-specific serine/threonine protein kinase n=1 Tax=Quercus suber TaxID=58331 RepID=A0AAW0KHH3_QUESU